MALHKYWHVRGYRVLSTIGHGAQSVIYRVVDVRDGRQYALKRVMRRGPQDDRFIEQAEVEFTVGHCLSHPHLRRMFEFRRVKRLLRLREVHLLMEWVPGETIERRCPEDMFVLTGIFLAAATGLQAMHQAGFLHCDLKPTNIIIENGNPTTTKVIDFGQSCPIGYQKARIQGTPEYIAPEQVDRLPLDVRTDIYNFGATMYWAVTKKNIPTVLPHRAENAGRLMTYDPRYFLAPDQVDPRVPTALSKLILECCQRSPSLRPVNIALVISRLELARQLLSGLAGNGAQAAMGSNHHARSTRQGV